MIRIWTSNAKQDSPYLPIQALRVSLSSATFTSSPQPAPTSSMPFSALYKIEMNANQQIHRMGNQIRRYLLPQAWPQHRHNPHLANSSQATHRQAIRHLQQPPILIHRRPAHDARRPSHVHESRPAMAERPSAVLSVVQ